LKANKLLNGRGQLRFLVKPGGIGIEIGVDCGSFSRKVIKP